MEFEGVLITTEIVSRKLLDEAEALFHRNSFEKQFSNWQFSPRFGSEIKAVTARYNGLLVGFNATMPVILSLNGDSEQSAIWSCDFIVDHKYRGKGLGSAIKQCLKDKFPIPTFALGISDKAMSVLQHSKWKTQVGLNVYNKIIKPQNNRQRVLYVLSRLSSYFKDKAKYKSDTELKYLSQLPNQDELDCLWQSIKSEYGVCIARTGAYVNWRYGDNKALNYKFVATFEQHKVVALMVYRFYNEELKIIDYIGPVNSSIEFVKLTKSLLKIDNINQINFNVNQPILSNSLTKLGFLKSRYFSNFAYFFRDRLFPNEDWTLTAGDSDGELISAIKSLDSKNTPSDVMESYSIRQCSEVEFLKLSDEWKLLLENSTANPLFMSWYWCSCWWKTWQNSLNEIGQTKLAIQLIYQSNKLVGIIPLYSIEKKKLCMSYQEYHFLGNAWHIIPTVRSEYISPVFLDEQTSALEQYFIQWFNNKAWNNVLVWPDADSKTLNNQFNYFAISSDEAVKIDTRSQSFELYKHKLGKNTRLKGINRQKMLVAEYSDAQWGSYQVNPEHYERFFCQLNDFHQQRWQKDCFDEQALAFHKQLLSSSLNCHVYLNYLTVQGTCISVQYNLKVNNTIYNLQAGFSQDFNRKYSLGTMHLMKSIEQSFSDESCEYFDMLVGGGLNEQYKKHFKGETSQFTTFLIFPSFLMCQFKRMSVLIKGVLLKKLRPIIIK